MRKSLLFVVLVIVVVVLIRANQSTPKRASASGTEPKFTYDLEGRPITATLSGPLFGDDDVVRVAAIPWLTRVNLANSHVSGRSLTALSGLPELKSLDLSRTTLSHEDFTAVTKLTTLTELLLNECPWLTDEHLHSLIALQNLQKLELSSAGVTAAGIGGLSALPKLKNLTVGHCATLDDSSVEHLVRLSNLDDLELPNTDLNIPAYLDLCERLVGVWNPNMGEFPKGLREISQRGGFSPKLDSFSNRLSTDRSRQPLLPGDLALVSSLRGLKSLHLEGEITDAMFLELGPLPQLESLHLMDTLITDEGLQRLSGFPNLKRFSMFSSQVTGSGLKHLKHTPSLLSLSLSTSRGDGLLEQLAPLQDLRELVLRAPITDDELHCLPILAQLLSAFFRDSQVRGPGIESLSQQPSLISVTFRDGLLDDTAIEPIAKVTSLRSFGELRGNRMTDEGKARLQKLRPALRLQ